MADKNIYTKLSEVQNQVKVSKTEYNSFGKYAYRTAEGILDTVKPLLARVNLCLILSDEIELIGDQRYIKVTASIIDEKGERVETKAYAREPLEKKGMDASQITGSTSSYARKYALCGLFGIGSEADSDETNTHEQTKTVAKQARTTPNNQGVHQTTKEQTISENEQKNLFEVYNTKELQEELKKMLSEYQKKTTAELTKEEYGNLIIYANYLKQQVSKKAQDPELVEI